MKIPNGRAGTICVRQTFYGNKKTLPQMKPSATALPPIKQAYSKIIRRRIEACSQYMRLINPLIFSGGFCVRVYRYLL